MLDDLSVRHVLNNDEQWHPVEEIETLLRPHISNEECAFFYVKSTKSKAAAEVDVFDQIRLGRRKLIRKQLKSMVQRDAAVLREIDGQEEFKLRPIRLRKDSSAYGVSTVYVELFLRDYEWHTAEHVAQYVAKFVNRKALGEWYLKRLKLPKDTEVTDAMIEKAVKAYSAVRALSDLFRDGRVVKDLEREGGPWFKLLKEKGKGRR